jgi:hypothetical protein
MNAFFSDIDHGSYDPPLVTIDHISFIYATMAGPPKAVRQF